MLFRSEKEILDGREERLSQRKRRRNAAPLADFIDEVNDKAIEPLLVREGRIREGAFDPSVKTGRILQLAITSRSEEPVLKPVPKVGRHLLKLDDFLAAKRGGCVKHMLEGLGGFLDLILDRQHLDDVLAIYFLA